MPTKANRPIRKTGIKGASTASNPPKSNDRGRAIVEAKLVSATASVLAKQGPRAVTIRDIARRAGVNHGQIHHYFGGKKGLIEATVKHLATEHADHAAKREHIEFDRPVPLSLGQDETYIRAVIRLVLDGQLDLATLELEEGISVPRHIIEEMAHSKGLKKPTTEMKGVFAAAMAIELAWASLEPYILRQIGATAREENKIRDIVAEISREIVLRMDHQAKV